MDKLNLILVITVLVSSFITDSCLFLFGFGNILFYPFFLIAVVSTVWLIDRNWGNIDPNQNDINEDKRNVDN